MSRGTIDDFCTQVCRCVRFWPDHKAITAELTAHLEDHAAALAVSYTHLTLPTTSRV